MMEGGSKKEVHGGEKEDGEGEKEYQVAACGKQGGSGALNKWLKIKTCFTERGLFLTDPIAAVISIEPSWSSSTEAVKKAEDETEQEQKDDRGHPKAQVVAVLHPFGGEAVQLG